MEFVYFHTYSDANFLLLYFFIFFFYFLFYYYYFLLLLLIPTHCNIRHMSLIALSFHCIYFLFSPLLSAQINTTYMCIKITIYFYVSYYSLNIRIRREKKHTHIISCVHIGMSKLYWPLAFIAFQKKQKENKKNSFSNCIFSRCKINE